MNAFFRPLQWLSGFLPVPRRGRSRVLWDASIYLAGREATLLVSAIAFSFMISIFPFIILLLTLAHHLQWRELRETIFSSFHVFFPTSQDFIIRNLQIYTESVGGLHILSILLLAWGVSAFFFSLEAGLDSAYRAPSYRKFARSQILGTVMAIGLGVGVFAFMALFRAIHLVGSSWVTLDAEQLGLVDRISSTGLGVLLTVLVFMVSYRWLPNRKRTIRQILPETLAAATAWLAGNAAFRASLPLWSLKEIYGPFYVSVTLLLWAFAWASLMLFFARLSADGFFKRLPKPPTAHASAQDHPIDDQPSREGGEGEQLEARDDAKGTPLAGSGPLQ